MQGAVLLGANLTSTLGIGTVITSSLLVVFAVPSSILAWQSVKDRRERTRREGERQEERHLLELIGTTFFGPDRSKWPQPGQTNRTPVTTLVEAVAHQVKPSNGKTLAMTAEETKEMLSQHTERIMNKLNEQGDIVGDLQRGMAAISVLVAEHVSDGHGGKTSW